MRVRVTDYGLRIKGYGLRVKRVRVGVRVEG
jgi:hypothetical protein